MNERTESVTRIVTIIVEATVPGVVASHQSWAYLIKLDTDYPCPIRDLDITGETQICATARCRCLNNRATEAQINTVGEPAY